jgi:hypothetical protein
LLRCSRLGTECVSDDEDVATSGENDAASARTEESKDTKSNNKHYNRNNEIATNIFHL